MISCSRAVEQDDARRQRLADGFYRGFMRSLAATRYLADVMRAFRRCRELLSIVLGIEPSDDTERLYRRISGRV